MIKLEVKLSSNVNGVIEETANCGNVAIITVWETLDLQSEFSEGKLIDINKESGWDKKENVPEKVRQAKNFTLKKLLEIFPDIKNAKIKCWKLIQMDNLPRHRKDAHSG